MEQLETICNLLAAGLLVWGLTRALYGAGSHKGRSAQARAASGSEVSTARQASCGRLLCLTGAGVCALLSAKAAVWLAMGAGGMVLSWLVLQGVYKMAVRFTTSLGSGWLSSDAEGEPR